jgi:ComF family protein
VQPTVKTEDAGASDALRPRALSAAIAALGRAALNLIYPPTCLACRAATAEAEALCARCWREMRFIERPFCERLGTPFEQDLGVGLISPQAAADPPVFGRARAAARFEDGPARSLVHRLKYSDRDELARPLGRWMARAGADILADADVLAAIPLHPLRLWLRRFNQAAALAEAVGRQAGLRCDPFLLARVKATRAQVGLSRAQRAENVQGAFRVPEGAEARVRGARIVLVDDVLTSGATANSAARVLLRFGARSVDVLVFARVVTGA